MYSVAALVLCSFLISLLVTPLCRKVAARCGWVDHPGEARKIHRNPVPRIGGVPILFGYGLAMAILILSPLNAGHAVAAALPSVLVLMPGLLLVFATGLIDDIVGLKPWHKLTGEIAAAAYVCWAGVRIAALGGHHVNHWIAIPLTVFWLVGCSNAVNLIDGVDGLATGVGVFAALTMLIAALMGGNNALALAIAPLFGALCGFLRYNFNPASIFLGDSGSLSIGFLLGCFGIVWSQKSATMLGITAPLMALSIPLLDTALAIARRILRGQPVFGADRRHIHHLLLDRGLTPRRVALVLYGICGIAATLSLLQSMLAKHYGGAILVLFCAAVWGGIQHLGYAEFNLAGRLIQPRTFQRVLDAQMRLRALEQDLKTAGTVDDCWAVIRAASRDLGFQRLSMRLDHTVYRETLAEPANGHSWTLRVPLSETEFVEFARDSGAPSTPAVMGPRADLLQRALEPKLPGFQAGTTGDMHRVDV
jgi:UDP-GlcNAc:undecaprenyl-phosphate/decaprenyl-phosphate GlcNAc-1-phosphate transferase